MSAEARHARAPAGHPRTIRVFCARSRRPHIKYLCIFTFFQDRLTSRRLSLFALWRLNSRAAAAVFFYWQGLASSGKPIRGRMGRSKGRRVACAARAGALLISRAPDALREAQAVPPQAVGGNEFFRLARTPSPCIPYRPLAGSGFSPLSERSLCLRPAPRFPAGAWSAIGVRRPSI